MANLIPHEGTSLPPAPEGAAPRQAVRVSFRVVYLAIFTFILLYVFTVRTVEASLQLFFEGSVAEAIDVSPANGPVVRQIREGVRRVRHSGWVKTGRIELQVIVQGADGNAIYFQGAPALPPPDEPDPLRDAEEASRVLPAQASVFVTVPHNALLANLILVAYATLLLTSLFLYNRSIERKQEAEIRLARNARDAAAGRAAEIETELQTVRERLTDLGAMEDEHVGEIRTLQSERGALQRKLNELTRREEELRARASSASELDAERETLEELLDEALRDLNERDQEIGTLQTRLKSAAKSEGKGGRSRELDHLSKRMRTLYKNVEFDDRALRDLQGLRDGAMSLKAEEAVKRLSDEAENAAVRRKVGGLPGHLNIFELGFAGKGRIYYTHGTGRRFKILCVGAKNSQKTDLEYLSRL